MRTSERGLGMVGRALVGGSLMMVAVGLIAPGVSGAAPHAKVRPHQYFAGSVNGSLGTPVPAMVKVVCPGPVSFGRTGHPLAGQTVAVGRAISTESGSGYTGSDATVIGVFFGAPPPGSAGPGQVTFARYGMAKAVPTSLSLPCGGTGVVTFVPFPVSPPTSRSATVAVEYANVAAASAR